MINLDRELPAMMDSVEKMINDRRQQLNRLEALEAKFWSDVAGPAILSLGNAIDKLKERSCHLEPHISDEPIRTLRVRNDDDDKNWEFSFTIKTIREDLKLWVKLGKYEKKYPLEKIDKDQIYKEFLLQYKTELVNKFVPK